MKLFGFFKKSNVSQKEAETIPASPDPAPATPPTFTKDELFAEANRFFDDSSLAGEKKPRLVLLVGGPACGKTTMRRERFATGFVVVDAAQVFLNLSRDGYYPFPDPLEEPMHVVGTLVAMRAVAERRHIVTEFIGADHEALQALLNTFLALGYSPEINQLDCDLEEAIRRNESRGPDCISAHYAEPFHHGWLLKAATRAPQPAAPAPTLPTAAPYCLMISRAEVERLDLTGPAAVFRHLISTPEMIKEFREGINILFDGYNDTPEELWQIPAMRDYVTALDQRFSYWLYFLSRKEYGLQCISLCLLPHSLPEADRVQIHAQEFDLILERWGPSLFQLCQSIGLNDSVPTELLHSGIAYFRYGPS